MSRPRQPEAGTRALYEHVPHPHVQARREQGPVRVADQAPGRNAYARFNSWLGLRVTEAVGTMTCAWVFAGLALVSLPAAVQSRSLIVIVSWVAQTLLQLVLLSIILFGQSIQSQAADARAEATYKDAEAILHGQAQQAEHLAAQDAALIDRLDVVADQIAALHTRLNQQGGGQ